MCVFPPEESRQRREARQRTRTQTKGVNHPNVLFRPGSSFSLKINKVKSNQICSTTCVQTEYVSTKR